MKLFPKAFKALFTALFLFVSIIAYSQTAKPSTLPSPRATSAYYEIGIVRLDSFGVQFTPRIGDYKPVDGLNGIRFHGDTMYIWSIGGNAWVPVTTGGITTPPSWNSTMAENPDLLADYYVNQHGHIINFDSSKGFTVDLYGLLTNGEGNGLVTSHGATGDTLNRVGVNSNGAFVAAQKISTSASTGLVAEPNGATHIYANNNISSSDIYVNADSISLITPITRNYGDFDMPYASGRRFIYEGQVADPIEYRNFEITTKGTDTIQAGLYWGHFNNGKQSTLDWGISRQNNGTSLGASDVIFRTNKLLPLHQYIGGTLLEGNISEVDYTLLDSTGTDNQTVWAFTPKVSMGVTGGAGATYNIVTINPTVISPNTGSLLTIKQNDSLFVNVDRYGKVKIANTPQGSSSDSILVKGTTDSVVKAVAATAFSGATNFASIAAMQAYTGASTSVYVTDTLRGGNFLLVNSSTLTADGGTRFAATGLGANKWWVRQYSQANGLNVAWFGAVDDWDLLTGTGTDNKAAIQLAINAYPARNTKVIFTKRNTGIWGVGDSLILGNGTVIEGQNPLFPTQFVNATDSIIYKIMTGVIFYNNTNGFVTSASEVTNYRSQGINIKNIAILGNQRPGTGVRLMLMRQTTNSTAGLKTVGLGKIYNVYFNGGDTSFTGYGTTDSWSFNECHFTNSSVAISGGTGQHYILNNDFYNLSKKAVISRCTSSPGDIIQYNEFETRYADSCVVEVQGTFTKIGVNNFLTNGKCIIVRGTAQNTEVYSNNFWRNSDDNITVDSSNYVTSIHNNNFEFNSVTSSLNYNRVAATFNNAQRFVWARKSNVLSVMSNTITKSGTNAYTGTNPMVFDTVNNVQTVFNYDTSAINAFPDERAFSFTGSTFQGAYDVSTRRIAGNLTAVAGINANNLSTGTAANGLYLDASGNFIKGSVPAATTSIPAKAIVFRGVNDITGTTNFNYDSVQNFVGLGATTPAARLNIGGTVIGALGTNGNIYRQNTMTITDTTTATGTITTVTANMSNSVTFTTGGVSPQTLTVTNLINNRFSPAIAGSGITMSGTGGIYAVGLTGAQLFTAGTSTIPSFVIPNGTVASSNLITGMVTAESNVIKYYNGTNWMRQAQYTNANNATGDILVANGTSTFNQLADIATGNVLISGGVGVAPLYGKVGLTTHVSGILPIANGGTGAATVAANTVFGNNTASTAAPAFSTSLAITGTGSFGYAGAPRSNVNIASLHSIYAHDTLIGNGILDSGNATIIGNLSLPQSGSITTATTFAYSGAVTGFYPTVINFSTGRYEVLDPPVASTSSTNISLSYAGDYAFTGTTGTYTLPAVDTNKRGRWFKITVKNAGSGNLTVNSNAGGNDIYDTSAVNTLTIAAGNSRDFVLLGSLFYVE